MWFQSEQQWGRGKRNPYRWWGRKMTLAIVEANTEPPRKPRTGPSWHTCAVKFYPVICRKMDITGDRRLRKTNTPCFLFAVPRLYGGKWNHGCLWLKSRVDGRGTKETTGEGWQRVGSGERRDALRVRHTSGWKWPCAINIQPCKYICI